MNNNPARSDLAVASMLNRVNGVGEWLAPLGLRLLLAWEFYESGLEKLQGENWFADLAGKFPAPFSWLSPNVNWTLATWVELIGSLALLLGLGTRYVALSLWVLTIVATAAVHWPSEWSSIAELWQGYAISNHGFGNFKLPLLFLVMLLPLIVQGGGRLSLDHLLWRVSGQPPVTAASPDARTWGLVLMVLALPMVALLPVAAALICTIGIALVVPGVLSDVRHAANNNS